MNGMFTSASEFNGDISGWDVGLLTRADNMFQSAGDFKQGTFCSESWFLSPVGNSHFEGRSQIFCNSTDKDKGDSIASKVRVIPTTTNKINATTLREARMTFGAGSQEYQEAARNMK